MSLEKLPDELIERIGRYAGPSSQSHEVNPRFSNVLRRRWQQDWEEDLRDILNLMITSKAPKEYRNRMALLKLPVSNIVLKHPLNVDVSFVNPESFLKSYITTKAALFDPQNTVLSLYHLLNRLTVHGTGKLRTVEKVRFKKNGEVLKIYFT